MEQIRESEPLADEAINLMLAELCWRIRAAHRKLRTLPREDGRHEQFIALFRLWGRDLARLEGALDIHPRR
jgi:hypothetical protein